MHVRPTAAALVSLLLFLACNSAGSDARSALARGKQLMASHTLDEAGARLTDATRLDPRLHEAFARLARVRLEQGRAAEAEAAALRAAALVPQSAYYSELLGRSQLAANHGDRALASFEQAITLDATQTARIAFTIGVLRERSGKPDEAQAAYERAATADASAVPPRLALVRIDLRAERLDAAKRRIDELRPRIGAEAPEHAVFAALDARVTVQLAERESAAIAENQLALGAFRDSLSGSAFGSRASALGDGGGTVYGTLMGDAISDSYGFAAVDVVGTGGLGLTGTGGSGGYGDRTIGLGSLGTIGHGAGTGSGVGAGSGGFGGTLRGGGLPTVATGTPTVSGPLSPEVIRRVVRRHMNELRSCYAAALGRNPALAGRFTLTFTIAATGAAEQVSATGLGDAAAESCMANAVQRWMFPMPGGGGPVRVTYPLTLTPSSPATP